MPSETRSKKRRAPAAQKKTGKTGSSKTPPRISAVVITHNEETRLPRCLESLSFADEIVVLDSGSTDATRTVARRYGARVHSRAFDDFAAQKNHAAGLARGQWILSIDADEEVTPELGRELQAIARAADTDDRPVAYRLPRMTYYLGRWIRYGGWYPDLKLRFFRNGSGVFQGGPVHEELSVRGPIETLKHELRHYSYRSISDHLERIHRYSSLIALEKFKNGQRSSIPWALGKAVVKFMITYVYRGGFMDGRVGLVIAVLASYYNFLKYIKLWELHRMNVNEFPTTEEN